MLTLHEGRPTETERMLLVCLKFLTLAELLYLVCTTTTTNNHNHVVDDDDDDDTNTSLLIN